MSDDTENKTTRERISIANQVYASYPLFQQILEDIDRCHESPNIKGEDDPDCLLLTGTTGAGKTTIYKTYAQNYPIRETEEGSVVPIIYATIPAAATVKGLVKALLKAIGDPLYSKGTTIDQTDRLYGLLNDWHDRACDDFDSEGSYVSDRARYRATRLEHFRHYLRQASQTR